MFEEDRSYRGDQFSDAQSVVHSYSDLELLDKGNIREQFDDPSVDEDSLPTAMTKEHSDESDQEEQPQVQQQVHCTDEAVLYDAILKLVQKGEVVEIDPKFQYAWIVFKEFRKSFLVQNDGKNGVPVIPGIGWVQKKRKDQKIKKAHSKMCHILEKNYRYLGGIQYLISKYAYSKQSVKHLQAILGSSRKKGLSQISIRYLITNEGLCELITDESLILQTLEGLNNQSKADVRNVMKRLTPYFRQGTPDFRNMDALKKRIQKSKEFKKPCTYLENLLCLKSFYNAILCVCLKRSAITSCSSITNGSVSALFRQALGFVQELLKSSGFSNLKPRGRGNKLIDYESYVKTPLC